MEDWDHRDPFLHRIEVGAEHIDVLDHANNTAYINWCQDTAWRHSSDLGIEAERYREIDRAMVVRKATYDYFAAAFLGEQLDVATWLTATDSRLQMTRHFQIRRSTDGTTVFRGDWELVCIKLSSGRPVRMPEIFLSHYVPAVVGASV